MLEQVHLPRSLAAAFQALGEPDRTLIAGGTLVMPGINAGSDLKGLVSLRRLGLDTVSIDGGRATIGAAATLGSLAPERDLAFLSPALDQIASPTLRNMATVGGNLFAPSPYGDLATCFIALGAEAMLVDEAVSRAVPVETLVASGVRRGEIVTSVAFDLPPQGCFRFRKASRRALNSAAIVTVAAVLGLDGGTITACRIGLGGVAPSPVRARSVEAALLGKPLDRASVTAAAAEVAEDIAPATDPYASAWYRARVAPVHLARALLGQ